MASHTSLRNGEPDTMVGISASIARLRQWIARVASTHVPVLISGETGTGKEIVASAIHAHSARSSKRLLCLNCAALPDSLLESELFGYDRGAFTGAHEARAGLLRSCDGGTLFLDEVGDLSLPAQAKLLRVLEAKQVSRLGDGRTWPVDFRLVAATNRDLDAMVQQGLFRKDLFYRLRVACVHVPPLRDRIEDVPALIDQWVAVFNREFGVDIEGVAAEVMSCFMAHTWPGNVRELRNVLETAFITCTDGVIRLSDLPAYLQPRATPVADAPVGERERLLSTLASVHWNKSRAASLLNWSRMTLYRKLAKYNLAEADAPAAPDRRSKV